ncbi:MAG: GGDEF domain-containing protein [Deltaproteobacteria bacterium]|nr:GGDEF domain-containing protein [Deltaproteobacteria bacterium]
MPPTNTPSFPDKKDFKTGGQAGPSGGNPAASEAELQQEFERLMAATYETAKRLLPFMAKRRIPLTPYNYRLFYDYFEGGDERLKQRLEEILRTSAVLTQELSERLYHEFYDYIGDSARKLTLVGQKIGSIGLDLEANLEKTLDSTGRYREFLSDAAVQLNDPGSSNGKFKEAMEGLLRETKSALNEQSDLADHIDSASRVIATLTRELKDQTRLASVDELTQLYNRRYMTLQFAAMAEKHGADLVMSMILFDLDRFKSINDNYGHNIGDRVLLVCSKILQNLAGKEGHIVCRYGGEEFVVLCRGLELAEAERLADSVRRQLEETSIQIRGNSIPVTISGGVSRYRHPESLEAFLDRADQALYRAKSTGRNKIVLEEAGA